MDLSVAAQRSGIVPRLSWREHYGRIVGGRRPGRLRAGANSIALTHGWTEALRLLSGHTQVDPVRAKQLVPRAFGSAASARKELHRLRRLIDTELPALQGMLGSRVGGDCGYWLDRELKLRPRRDIG